MVAIFAGQHLHMQGQPCIHGDRPEKFLSQLHVKFGVGVIVSSEGRGADARVQVNFGGSGMKWLALEYAKLTPI